MGTAIAHWLTIATPFIILAGQLYAKRDRKAKQVELVQATAAIQTDTVQAAATAHLETLEKVAEVHTLVNSQAEQATADIADLKGQLIDAGIPIKETPKL